MVKDVELPEVPSGPDSEGFVDLDMRIVRAGSLEDGGFLLEAKCRREQEIMGFALMLSGEWDAQPLGESGEHAYWGTARLISLGQESDTLVAALDSIYGTNLGVCTMPGQLDVMVVGIGDDPSQLASAPIHMKLFFEPDDKTQTRYAEVFLNVYLEERRLELHEKDPEYRAPMMRVLGGVAG
jgi:hypothetical protein